MKQYSLKINGLDIRASFSEETIHCVFLPLLAELTGIFKRKNRRIIVYLAGPPGAGKSTLAAFLQQLSQRHECLEPIQAVGIDGFHYSAEYIGRHAVIRDGIEIAMKDVKGCPESFDIDKLYEAVTTLKDKDIKWPSYDRRLHDIIPDAVKLTGNIVLIEGNWLLLEEGRWAELRSLCDYCVMVRADESVLKDRLIQRKIQGGLTAREAEEFYINSDRRNIARCLGSSLRADLNITLDARGNISAAPGGLDGRP